MPDPDDVDRHRNFDQPKPVPEAVWAERDRMLGEAPPVGMPASILGAPGPEDGALPTALAEFTAAAREAHRTQKAAQAAAQRYAAAVKRLSEVVVEDGE